MSEYIYFDGTRYIPAGDAAALSDLTRDYVGKLCREGKVRGRRVGKNWYVDDDQFREYLILQNMHREQRRASLSEARAAEYRRQTPVSRAASPVDVRTAAHMSHTSPASPARDRRRLPVQAGDDAIEKRLARAVAAQGIRLSRSASVIGGSMNGTADAALRTVAHVPAHLTTPLGEFMHKLVALTVAFMLTFGTYALVDPTYARFALGSIAENVRTLIDTGNRAGRVATSAETQFAAAAENPQSTLASALTVVPEAAVRLARYVNTRVDTLVYGIVFPDRFSGSLANSGSVSVEIAPYRAASGGTVTVSTASASTTPTSAEPTTIVQHPIVERIIERERVVAAGGISEEYLAARIQELDNSLSSRFYAAASANSTSIAQNYAVTAQTNAIDKLRHVAIVDSTFTGGSISGASVAATSLSVSGGASLHDTSVDGDISASGSLTLTGTTSVISAANATITNATSTNFFAALSTFTTSIIDTLSAAVATITNLTTTELVATNATTTNATTTNLAVTNLTSFTAPVAPYFTATSTTATSTFAGMLAVGTTSPWGSGLLTIGTSTSLLMVDNISGYVGIGTTTPGSIFSIENLLNFTTATSTFYSGLQAAGLGVSGPTTLATTTVSGGLIIGSGSSSGAFTVNGLAVFNSGLLSLASTTIGDGTQAGGLTVFGGATTTGDMYIGGALTVASGATIIGETSSDSLTVNSSINSDLVPDQNITRDIGSASFYWRNGYFGTVNANNLSAASTSIGGTNSETFTINADNATSDTEDSNLVFFRGTVVPNAVISWNSALGAKRFELNQSTFISNLSGSTTQTTFTLRGAAGQTGSIFDVQNSSGSSLFSIGPSGQTIVGGSLTVEGSLTTTQQASTTLFSSLGPAYFGSTATTTIDSAGNVSVAGDLTVAGTTDFTGLLSLASASTSRLSVFSNAYFGGTATSTFDSLGGLALAGTLSVSTTTATSTLSTGGLVIGTNQFIVQQTSGRIGIGTTSPASIFDIYGTDALRLPVGTTAQRPAQNGIGQVRYNTTTHQFEGYGDNSVWQGLGGVIDADQDTYITADTNNADEDTLRFFTTGLQRLTITNLGNVGIGTTSPWAKFAIHAQNGETNTSLFTIASSTAAATTTLFNINNSGQLSLGTASPDASALLQLDSTSQGFLPPRMTTAQKNAIASAAAGLTIFDSSLNKLNVYNGSAWKNVGSTEIGGEVTSGTQGSVLFIGDGDILAQDNANFNFSTSTNRLLLSQASSTRLSVFGTAYFGGTATTTIDSAGNVFAAGGIGVGVANTSAGSLVVQGADQSASTKSLTITDSLAAELLTVFNNGLTQMQNLLATASSTIGDGTEAGGLTISGGATTTGNSLVQGNATTSGSQNVAGILTVSGSATSTFSAGLQANLLNITSASATSTFANGLSLSDGCIQLQGTSLCSNSSGVTLTGIVSATTGTNVTYTPPSNISYIEVEVWGAGGGGGGGSGSTGSGGAGGAGGNSCFASGSTACNSASTMATSTGGSAGSGGSTGGSGGDGGSNGSGVGGDLNLAGQRGGTGNSAGDVRLGGTGGSAPRAGRGGTQGAAGGVLGGGGAGGQHQSGGTGGSGGGGGSGGYTQKLITSPSGTYSYTIGAGGTAGAAGTGGGTAGGAGGAGGIIIREYTTGAATAGSVGDGTQGQFAFYNASGANLTATSSLFLSQAGNVGIGTSSPVAKLDIYGNAAFSGADRYLNFGATSTNSLGTDGYGFRDNSGTIEFKNSGGSWEPIQQTSTQYARVSGGNTTVGPDNTWVVLDITSEQLDPSNISDPSTEKITPTEAGYYIVTAQTVINQVVSDQIRFGAGVYVNGAAMCQRFEKTSGIGDDQHTNVVCIVYVDGVDDYIQAYGLQRTAASATMVLANMSVGKLGGSDYAEYVVPELGTSPADYEPGELLCIKSTSPDTYGHCESVGDPTVVGIVSTLPGVIGNSPGQLQERDPFLDTLMLPMAMLGRVPTKVNMEGGPIAIGDRIAVSSVPGVGKKAGVFEPSVGIALESFSDESGMVLVFIDLQNPPSLHMVGEGLLGGTGEDGAYDFITGLLSAITTRMTASESPFTALPESLGAGTGIGAVRNFNTIYNAPFPVSGEGDSDAEALAELDAQASSTTNALLDYLSIVPSLGKAIGELDARTAFLSVSSDFDIGATTSPATILFVDASGKIGIGTSTPSATLAVGAGSIAAYDGAVCASGAWSGRCYGTLAPGGIYGDWASFARTGIAERYEASDTTLAPGELVSIDRSHGLSVKRADASEAVFGVVATAAGVILGDTATSGTVPVVLTGRAPVRVNLEGGPIAIGDRVAASSVAGTGMKAGDTAYTIGIALEEYATENPAASSTIEVLIQPELTLATGEREALAALTRFGISVESDSASTSPSHVTPAVAEGSFMDTFLRNIFARVGAWLASATNGITEVFASAFNASEKICIDGECLTSDDIRALKQFAAAANATGGVEEGGVAQQGALEIEIHGSNPAHIDVGASYADLGASASTTDDALKALGVRTYQGGQEVASVSIDTSEAATHTVEYRVLDGEGNVLASAVRTIVVGSPGATVDEEETEDSGQETATSTPSAPENDEAETSADPAQSDGEAEGDAGEQPADESATEEPEEETPEAESPETEQEVATSTEETASTTPSTP